MNKLKDTFIYDGDTYKIDLGSSKVKPNIVNLRTGSKPKNQKGVLRKVLYNYGYDIPTDSNFNTHQSISLLSKLLNNEKLTEKEQEQKL